MSSPIFLAGGIVGLVWIGVFVAIGRRLITAVQGAVIMVIIAGIVGVLMEFGFGNDDTINATCAFALFGSIVGFWTFVFGRMLEQWASKQPK
jgi:hypothetical protein